MQNVRQTAATLRMSNVDGFLADMLPIIDSTNKTKTFVSTHDNMLERSVWSVAFCAHAEQLSNLSLTHQFSLH